MALTMAAISWKALFTQAERAREAAHAPYSGFAVGAAIACDNGKTVSGCNVENASFGLTVCAERHAVGQMQLLGGRPRAVAIVVDSQIPTPPCGMCRQVLAEFAGPELEIRSRTLSGFEASYTLGALLPHTFTAAFLPSSPGAKRGGKKG
jgi:cytidine deaminase